MSDRARMMAEGEWACEWDRTDQARDNATGDMGCTSEVAGLTGDIAGDCEESVNLETRTGETRNEEIGAY